MDLLEQRFFEYQIQVKMNFYMMSRAEAIRVVKKMKAKKTLWKEQKNQWFDMIHPY